jgi:hypothetical protein
MLYLLIGAAIVLLIMLGAGKSFLKLPTWRIGSAIGSLFMFAAAFFLFMNRAWPAAIVVAVIGIWMAVSARFPRAHQRSGPKSDAVRADRMSEAEARSILGVGEGATREEIQAAYSRLMKRVHPDHGGAAGLASQLNAARDRLLKR